MRHPVGKISSLTNKVPLEPRNLGSEKIDRLLSINTIKTLWKEKK